MGPVADIFVPMRASDSVHAVRCVESVRTHLGRQTGRVCVVAGVLADPVREALEKLGCDFLNETDVIGDTSSPIFSQLLKWELRRFSTTATYLVIDAGQILTRSTHLWVDQQSVMFCENRYRFGYYFCFNYFFGRIPQPAAPASGRMVHFNRAVLDEMVAKIETRYKMPWPVATTAILQQVCGTAFDAAQIFASYSGNFSNISFVPKPASEVLAGAGSDGEKRSGSCEHLRDRLGNSSESSGVVRMSTLGYNGRFANQIFQYAYLKRYANQHGLRAECPPWIGNSLFGHRTVLGENELPIYREDKGDADEMIRFDPMTNRRDFELWGYFQDPRHWSGNRQEFRGLFQPLPFLKNPLDEALARLRAGGKTLVAIHLRRGDFSGGATFWPAPEAWYLRWLKEVWSTLANPVLYVATDDPKNVLPQFAAYQPLTTGDLNMMVNGAEYYSDFYVLSQCDVLGISNSTFSFAAAMMNTTATLFVRPDPVAERMIEFDPWTSEVQLKKAEDQLQTRVA